jgi:hypothetical protein
MKQSPLEADNPSAGEEIPCYGARRLKSPRFDPVVSQIQ